MTLRTGHQALPDTIPKDATVFSVWRRVSLCVNEILHGGQNNRLDFTLTANSATTTVNDNRIGGLTRPVLQATSATAATEAASGNLWVDTPTQYSVVIHHTNNAVTTRTFAMDIGG